jgi:hypothetical protein
VAQELLAGPVRRHSRPAEWRRPPERAVLTSKLAGRSHPVGYWRGLWLGGLLAHAVTERAFSRSLSSVFSSEHQPTRQAQEQWRLVRRRRCGGHTETSRATCASAEMTRPLGNGRSNEPGAAEARVGHGHPALVADLRACQRANSRPRRRAPRTMSGHYPQLEAPEHVATAIEAASHKPAAQAGFAHLRSPTSSACRPNRRKSSGPRSGRTFVGEKCAR